MHLEDDVLVCGVHLTDVCYILSVHKWRWIGNTLRNGDESTEKQALHWTEILRKPE
jgi:hypothetical protein